MDERQDLLELLDHINPLSCDYQEWLNVGMALKHEGYYAKDWDDWSRRDADRYHPGECFKKWSGFGGSDTPVTAGTIVKMAKVRGYVFHRPDKELDWNDAIGGADELKIIDEAWVESREFAIPEKWDPAAQLITYLDTLFEADENVGYVTESWEKDGKILPSKGCWDRTAGQLIEELSKCGGDIGAVIGDCNEKAGAWIRFNPLDGKGVKNSNVTEFRYALVESDTIEPERQKALIEELELPVACLVYSGGKSLHAIVKIDAYNQTDYRSKVDYLYKVCEKNGLSVDKQNKNPSRLSRMPGVIRNGKKQYLLATNIGKSSFEEWKEWIESVTDDLPEPESMAEVWDNLPELSPVLIDGILRQGHKMLVAGPSKAGKSYILIELCIAIAEGEKWLGKSCAKGRVLYVNLELDKASCFHRFKDVYTALGIGPNNLSNIDIWNLRGKSMPMDKLAPKLIRRAAKKNYIAIIIDPIYKIITGDENSADQMARFCNQFDKVCTELGCAVIYCHHHSKGAQGGKKSMDRASGSGVFARDPDALIDLIELNMTEALKKQQINRAICTVCVEALKKAGKLSDVPRDDIVSEKTAVKALEEYLRPREREDAMREVEKAREKAKHIKAWRIEGTLREFEAFEPINLYFDFPIHRPDDDDALKDIKPESDRPIWEKSKGKQKETAEQKKDKFLNAIKYCNFGDPPTIHQLANALGKSKESPMPIRTVRNWIEKFGYKTDGNGFVVKDTEQESSNE